MENINNYIHKPERLFYDEAEPVACALLGLNSLVSHTSEIEEALYEEFNCSFYCFKRIIAYLLPIADCQNSSSGTLYRGFSIPTKSERVWLVNHREFSNIVDRRRERPLSKIWKSGFQFEKIVMNLDSNASIIEIIDLLKKEFGCSIDTFRLISEHLIPLADYGISHITQKPCRGFSMPFNGTRSWLIERPDTCL